MRDLIDAGPSKGCGGIYLTSLTSCYMAAVYCHVIEKKSLKWKAFMVKYMLSIFQGQVTLEIGGNVLPVHRGINVLDDVFFSCCSRIDHFRTLTLTHHCHVCSCRLVTKQL